MSKVIVRRDIDEECLSGLTDLHPILQRVYAARSISKQEDMDRELAGLIPYDSLKNIERAVKRIHQAIAEQQRILIIGDFDADGATSTALAVSALRAFGARNVRYLVPNRFAYGYGLTREIIDAALVEQKPDMIITVDNGVASNEGVAHANSLDIDVIVTDHHLPGDELPDAYAIVNPNLPGDEFPSKNLAGVGVIFYVMLALRSYLKQLNWFENQGLNCPNMAQYLDLVALGTVSDVVPLDHNNRILVHQGMRRIRAGYTRSGMLAIFNVAGRSRESLSATDLGFVVGPRLNAAGRLDDMSLGIACLLAHDPSTAMRLARKLDQLNKERRSIEVQMKREAFDIIDQIHLRDDLPPGICLFDESWHQGVIGLVAARVKERVHHPVIAFAKVDGNTLKGSARSIKGLHIRDVLDAVAKKHPDLLSKFGGHSMAAGLSIDFDNFKAFSRAFAEEVGKKVTKDQLCHRIETDGELTDEYINFSTAELLRESGPWGQGFPEPIFDGKFQLIDQHIVGRRHMKMILQLPGSDHYFDAIAFNVDLQKWPNPNCQSARIVYRLDVNEYRGRKKLQLLVQDILLDD